MRYRIALSLLAAGSALWLGAAAHADIGAIGSPVKPSNAPAPAAAPENTAAPAPAATTPVERRPLLIIRFNQRRVYFQHSLQQAVAATERIKPGATYDIVSYLPPSNNAEAGANLAAVVQEMQGMGVPEARIHTSTQPSLPGADSQEVHIFVQ